MLEFLLPPFMMCVVLGVIHVYMGMHVLRREVIFVDLALAQMAALGATVAQSLEGHAGVHGHAHVGLDLNVMMSFGFAALGALIFALTGRLKAYISQEAMVGIVYAVAAAAMILVLSKAPDGGEDIKRVFGGVLLLTEWHDVGVSGVVYALVGLALWFFRRPFHMLTWEPEEAEVSLTRPALWDFGFYLVFALVLTLSIQSAGVLLVFSFLIVPAVVTRLFWSSIVTRLFAGWLVATVAAFVGLGGAWFGDYPAGAAIIVAFGLLLCLAGLVRVALARKRYSQPGTPDPGTPDPGS
jgi:zinc/manganese transport system permease protein